MDNDLQKIMGCTCLRMRRATRRVTQFYDHHLAPSGLRISQFGILAVLKSEGALTINELAAELVIDRTTLGRNILPLERDGLITIKPSAFDRRSKELHLTDSGDKRYREARKFWLEAQSDSEANFGGKRSADLRALLQALVASNLGPAEGAALH